MPYEPTTPTVRLCRDLAAYIAAGWAPAAPDACDWDFFRRYADAGTPGGEKLSGRQVVFFPAEYDWDNGTRANEEYTHRVSCLVVERYPDGGDPLREWTAERVDFVHEWVVKYTRFTRGGPAPFNPLLMALGATVEVLDVGKLIGGGKLFYALTQLEFLELVP